MEPLNQTTVSFCLINAYLFEGDDLYRLIGDDGIVESTIYLHRKSIELEDLLKLKGKEVIVEGYVSLINSNQEKAIFCYEIKEAA